MSHSSPFKFSLSLNHAFILYTLGTMCYFKFGGIEVHLVRILYKKISNFFVNIYVVL
jgi:hypothetical protein